MSPAHISWLRCMSTVTSFTSPAETCTVHVLHVEGRNESKRGGGFTWRSLSRQWWPEVAVVPGSGGVGGSSSSVLFFFLFLCFSSRFYFFSLPLSVFFSFLLLFLSSALSLLFLLCTFFLLLPPCLFVSPVFIGKQGRDMAGAATVLPPHDCLRRHVSSVSPTPGRPRVSWAR